MIKVYYNMYRQVTACGAGFHWSLYDSKVSVNFLKNLLDIFFYVYIFPIF